MHRSTRKSRPRDERSPHDVREMCLGRLHPPRREGVHWRLSQSSPEDPRSALRDVPGTAAQSHRDRAWSLSTLSVAPRRLTLSRSFRSKHLASGCVADVGRFAEKPRKRRSDPWHPRCTATRHVDRARVSRANPRRAGRPPVHRASRHGGSARDRDLRLVFRPAAGRTRSRQTRRPELNDPAGCRGPRAVDAARGKPLGMLRAVWAARPGVRRGNSMKSAPPRGR